MDDDELYESEGDYGFQSGSEDESVEEESEIVPILTTTAKEVIEGLYDVIVKIGDWQKPIILEKHKGGFIQDWYNEYGSPGALLDLTGGKVDFIPEHWQELQDLLMWEFIGPYVLADLVGDGMDEEQGAISESDSKLLKPVYYADVAPIARTVGTSSGDEEWTLYTILDRRVPVDERMTQYAWSGRYLRAKRYIEYKDNLLSSLLYDVQRDMSHDQG